MVCPSPQSLVGWKHSSMSSATYQLKLSHHHLQHPSSSSKQTRPLPPSSTVVAQSSMQPVVELWLVDVVKSIYAGVIMIDHYGDNFLVLQQYRSPKTFDGHQRKALVALHRTLLHEHHDFFLASQHTTASDSLARSATKHIMPASMWCHGIHAFLELLRHGLPDSMEHMLSFIYLSYSMMARVAERVSICEATWIECLGDLARYPMAVENTEIRDRKTWSSVARMWYSEAADSSPHAGRFQHHLAVFARPNIVGQLFYHSKTLVVVLPCTNAMESIVLLFDLPETDDDAIQRQATSEASLLHGAVMSSVRGSDRNSHYERGSAARLLAAPRGLNCAQDPEYRRWPCDVSCTGAGRDGPRQNSGKSHRPGIPARSRPSCLVRLSSWLSYSHGILRCVILTIFLSHCLVTAYPVPPGIGDSNSPGENAANGNTAVANSDPLARTCSFLIMVAMTATIAVFGPRLPLKLDKEDSKDLSIPTIVALLAAIAVGFCNDPAIPIYLMGSLAGVSLGCSLWIALITATRGNSAMMHFARYSTPCVVIYMALQAATSADGSSASTPEARPTAAGGDGMAHAFWSVASPLLSVLGSVGLNALVNEKLEDLTRLAIWVLLQFGFERR